MKLGLDLSHWNSVDVTNLKESNIEFLYLKATEASSWEDETSLARARHTDVPYVGFYHLFRDVDWQRQLEHFDRYIRQAPFNLPPAVDVETRHIRGATNISDFYCGVYDMGCALKERYGQAVIYISGRGMRLFQGAARCFNLFNAYTGVWWADHTDEARAQGAPRDTAGDKNLFWQWTSKFPLQNQEVDANYYIGDAPLEKLGFRYDPKEDWFVQPK